MNRDRDMRRLSDVGEFALLEQLILPLARKADGSTDVGDDCAFVGVGDETLVVTADVGPRPLVRSLSSNAQDWEASGWLAVVATASDVASAGAKPLLLVNCVDAPNDLEVDSLESFMRGYFRALAEFGFQNGGGDLRHGPVLAARVFGVGILGGVRRIGRDGARPGDRLVAIGPTGSFMARYMLAAENERVGERRRQNSFDDIGPDLRFPKPQLRAMRILAEANVVRAASDTSDGLLGAIENIARRSGCGFRMELNDTLLAPEVKHAATLPKVESAWNLFFAWGDWSVAAVIDRDRVAEFERLCSDNDLEWRPIGWATQQAGLLQADLDGRDHDVVPVRNENFVTRGFNAGLDGHLAYILSTKILIPKSAS